MIGDDVSLGIAFLAGLLSFISPCVLPLVPAYLSYLSARATKEAVGDLAFAGAAASISTGGNGAAALSMPLPTTMSGSRSKKHLLPQFAHGLAFVAGFTAVFVGFGVTVNAGINLLNISFYDLQNTIMRVGGVVIIVFGLHVMGLSGWLLRRTRALFDKPNGNAFAREVVRTVDWLQSILYGDTRRRMNPRNPYGYAGSALMGVVFAAGWTPCIGPIYGSIMGLAINGSILHGSVLLTAYSLGLGVPFLLMTFATESARALIRRLQRYMRAIELFSGAFLIFIGVLLATNTLTLLTARSQWLSVFSFNLEDCGPAVVNGTVPLNDFGTCMNLGSGYKTIQNTNGGVPGLIK